MPAQNFGLLRHLLLLGRLRGLGHASRGFARGDHGVGQPPCRTHGAAFLRQASGFIQRGFGLAQLGLQTGQGPLRQGGIQLNQGLAGGHAIAQVHQHGIDPARHRGRQQGAPGCAQAARQGQAGGAGQRACGVHAHGRCLGLGVGQGSDTDQQDKHCGGAENHSGHHAGLVNGVQASWASGGSRCKALSGP